MKLIIVNRGCIINNRFFRFHRMWTYSTKETGEVCFKLSSFRFAIGIYELRLYLN